MDACAVWDDMAGPLWWAASDLKQELDVVGIVAVHPDSNVAGYIHISWRGVGPDVQAGQRKPQNRMGK